MRTHIDIIVYILVNIDIFKIAQPIGHSLINFKNILRKKRRITMFSALKTTSKTDKITSGMFLD